MSFSNVTQDRERDKFRNKNGQTVVATTLEGDTGILQGVQYDDVQAAYPDSTTETYSYYLNTVLQATVEITYTDSTKKTLSRARRV